MSLISFLSSIRRVYLSQNGPGRPRSPEEKGKQPATEVDEIRQAGSDSFARWKELRQMSDKQRDELDFQVRVMLKRLMERIKELEKAEESESGPG